MRRVALAAVLLAVLFGRPAAAGDGQSATAPVVAEMNRNGFAQFASIPTDDTHPVVSPFLMWYTQRFLTLKSPDARARALVEQLHRNGIAIETTVHAVRGRSAYSDSLARTMDDDLAVKTVWDEPGPLRDSAWQIDVRILVRDALDDYFSTDPERTRLSAPFTVRDGVRAVRLNAAGGARALYLFWATPSRLTELRAQMSPDVWQRLSSGFAESDVSIADFGLHGFFGVFVPVSGRDGFGFAHEPQRYAENTAWAKIAVSRSEVTAELTSHVQGFRTVYPPDYPVRPGTTADHVDYCCFLDADHRLVANEAVPLLYVLQDTRTGAILFIGQNG